MGIALILTAGAFALAYRRQGPVLEREAVEVQDAT
jgi:hypothetical protein